MCAVFLIIIIIIIIIITYFARSSKMIVLVMAKVGVSVCAILFSETMKQFLITFGIRG